MIINQRLTTIFGIYAIYDYKPFVNYFFEKLNEEIMKIGNTKEIIII